MDKTEQRYLIAEAVGFTDISRTVCFPTGYCWRGSKDEVAYAEIPDYLNDLNAMYDAEKSLSENDKHHYAGFLFLGKRCNFQDFCTNRLIYDVCHKTAEQKAEAFLKTLDLWEDE